ncbi:hypothetical protein EIP86_010410 [Pleurotus ostreatoroseus]|nr:hypothetical protein EIP86_010410 [Pleurotus ostreatoroseus]
MTSTDDLDMSTLSASRRLSQFISTIRGQPTDLQAADVSTLTVATQDEMRALLDALRTTSLANPPDLAKQVTALRIIGDGPSFVSQKSYLGFCSQMLPNLTSITLHNVQFTRPPEYRPKVEAYNGTIIIDFLRIGRIWSRAGGRSGTLYPQDLVYMLSQFDQVGEVLIELDAYGDNFPSFGTTEGIQSFVQKLNAITNVADETQRSTFLQESSRLAEEGLIPQTMLSMQGFINEVLTTTCKIEYIVLQGGNERTRQEWHDLLAQQPSIAWQHIGSTDNGKAFEWTNKSRHPQIPQTD